MAAETKIAEAPFDATRVARLLSSPEGVRVALVNLVTGAEFFSVPLAARTRESVVAALGVVNQLRARLAAAAPPPMPFSQRFGAGSAEELRPRPASGPAAVSPVAYSFADKVETLARHLDKMDALALEASANRLRAKGVSEKAIESSRQPFGPASIDEARDYWYVRRSGSRRYAVDVKTGVIYPVASKGVLKGQGFATLDTIGDYDWNDKWYAHRKLATPMAVEPRRSSLKSPETKAKRAPTYPLRTADNVPYGAWRGWEGSPEKFKAQGVVDPRGAYMGDPSWTGAKYSAGVSRNDIASAIRKDLAADVASGFLPPGTTFSVTTKDRSIRVTLMRMPGVRLVADMDGTPTDDYRRVKTYAEALLSAYNYDRSNSQYDYFDVGFYDHFDISDTLKEQQISDLRALAGLDERVDQYLTASIEEALEAKKLRSGWRRKDGPRVVNTPSGYRVEWVEWKQHPTIVQKVLTYDQASSPADALEVAESLARLYQKTKANRSQRDDQQ